jgi:hypothetical protein
MPNPRPTTEAWSRSFVALAVLRRSNGWPTVSASARPSASAIGGDAHGVRQKTTSATKSAIRNEFFSAES